MMTVVTAGVSPLISLQFVTITSWSQAGPARSNASHLLETININIEQSSHMDNTNENRRESMQQEF